MLWAIQFSTSKGHNIAAQTLDALPGLRNLILPDMSNLHETVDSGEKREVFLHQMEWDKTAANQWVNDGGACVKTLESAFWNWRDLDQSMPGVPIKLDFGAFIDAKGRQLQVGIVILVRFSKASRATTAEAVLCTLKLMINTNRHTTGLGQQQPHSQLSSGLHEYYQENSHTRVMGKLRRIVRAIARIDQLGTSCWWESARCEYRMEIKIIETDKECRVCWLEIKCLRHALLRVVQGKVKDIW